MSTSAVQGGHKKASPVHQKNCH